MEYKVSDVASAIESVAPLSLQADYDNSGLVVGRMSDSVSGVLIAVDITEAVIEEAVSLGVDMIVSHHPIIFKGLKRLNSSTCVERCVEMAIRYGITLYAAHTNLDSAPRGMSWRLGEILGLGDMTPLDSDGYGVVADIEECGVEEYIAWVAKALRLQSIRHSEIARDRISRVAICTGSGGSLLGSAIGSGADLYIPGDRR